MANRNYNASGTPTFQASGSSAPVKAEFKAISDGFAGVEAELDTKATAAEVTAARGSKPDLASRLGVALNADGTVKANTTVPTPASGDVSDKIATTQFVAQAALSTSLPGQTAHKWQMLVTDGVNAAWKPGALVAYLAQSSITGITYNGDGTINVVTHSSGHTVVFGYSGGNLASLTYYDTDGITQLMTETISYTGSNVSSTSWGIAI